VLSGLRIARQPPHRAHPYGHGKAETVAGLVVAFMLIGVAIFIGYTAVAKIARPGESGIPQPVALYIALGSILIKEGMFQYKIRLGKRVGSEAIIIDAWHHRSDALSSICVVGGIALAMINPALRVADPVAAIAVCFIILWIGIKGFGRTSSVLMDTPADEKIEVDIRDVATSVPGVMGTEKLITRRSGMDVIASLHVEVDPESSVRQAHETASAVRESIVQHIPRVKQVTVHIEPYYPNDHEPQQ
jgi:cation diffusion facilitator family transporter